MKQELANAIKHWDYIAPLVKYQKNKKEFDELVLELDELLIIVGNNEKNHLMGLVDILSNIISAYEKEHFPVNTKGIDALKYLMEAHNLHQADLSEIGSQGVISEILRGKRDLNLRQIKLLAKRFNLNPITFID